MKPEVFYTEAMYLYDANDEQIIRAQLYGVEGHPKLGNQNCVYTSRIVTQPDHAGTFETLNTIYKRKNYDQRS